MPATQKTDCHRCGTCCRNDGPALHREDIALLQHGRITHADLVTIRIGEPAYSPLVDRVEPSTFELIKVAGTAASWTCRFFAAADNRCLIYEDRPLECRLLNCREPEPLLRIIGRDTLARSDLINPGDPVLQLIGEHEQRCSYGELNELIEKLRKGSAASQILDRLSELLQEDIALRREAFEQWQLPPIMEMFVFGRPLFFSVQQCGLTVVEEKGRLQCKIMNAEF
ncbi:MAG: YkgJ family cysteine cluster protein [Deltaproteobacteria bacterium]